MDPSYGLRLNPRTMNAVRMEAVMIPAALLFVALERAIQTWSSVRSIA